MSAPNPTVARFSCWAEPAGAHHDDAARVEIDLEGIAPDEHILNLIRTHGRFYESDLLEHLADHGPRRGTYIDVGANIGNHSVFFGRFLADHVVAIEPNLALLPLLERNLRVNEVESWTTLPVALGARRGVGRLLLREGYENNAGAFCVVPDGPGPDGDPVHIETLDHVMAELGEHTAVDVRLVKLDIEGMEHDALKGSINLFERLRPDVVVEAAGDDEHRCVASFLSRYGYVEVARFCVTPTYHFIHPSQSWPRGVVATETKELR